MGEKRTPARIAWLEEGLKILEDEGSGALSIDSLAVRTGKTKGSFYHHFKNREVYVEALLAYYGELTEAPPGEEGGHVERLKKLTEYVFRISGRLELVIRAWALEDPKVKAFQDEMDEKRLSYLKNLYRAAAEDEAQADLAAFKNYSLYIGLQQIRHLYKGKEFKELLRGAFVS